MSSTAPIVDTCYGKVRGRREDEVESFLGIPFAKPPLQALRFRSPQPPEPWLGTRDTYEYAHCAVQSAALMDRLVGPDIVSPSENCLTLNLWRPAQAEANLPVMVFIHGGGFFCGSGSHPSINGTRLARNGKLIVVTIQYRLGVLGLLSHPVLEDPRTGHCGNWAFQDQIAALGWVQENIANFGGDKDKVTIFGESAGAVSVSLHCVSPISRPLFRRAIIESASPLPTTRQFHQQGTRAFLKKLNLTADLKKLQELSIQEILTGQGNWIAAVTGGRLAPRPVIDGILLPDWPDAMVDTGLTDALEIMTCYNQDELSYLSIFMESTSIPSTQEMVEETLGALNSQAHSLYATYVEAREQRGEATAAYDIWVALRSDQMIRVPAMEFLARHGDRGNTAWAICVTWQSSWRLPQIADRSLGACHIIELPLVFGTYDDTDPLRKLVHGEGVEEVSAAIQAAWIAFARTGDPNCENLPRWSTYTSSQRTTMMLGKRCKLEVDPRSGERIAMQNALLAV